MATTMFEQQRTSWMVRDLEEKIAALDRDPTLEEVQVMAAEVAATHRTKVLDVKPDPDRPGRFLVTSEDQR